MIRARPVCDPVENAGEIVVCAQGEGVEQFRIAEALRDAREDHAPGAFGSISATA